MQTHKANVPKLTASTDYTYHILHCNTKLVFCKSGRNVGMSMCPYIRIDTETDISNLAHPLGNLSNNLQLGNAFHIEILNTGIKSQLNLPVSLAHSGKNNLVCRKSTLHTCLDLPSAYTVRSKASLLNLLENPGVGTCLDSIMYVTISNLIRLLFYRFECLGKQNSVVIIKRSMDFLKVIP